MRELQKVQGWTVDLLLNLDLEALCTAVEQLLIHFHEQLQSIVYQSVYCPALQTLLSLLSLSVHTRELHGDGDHGNPAVTTVTPR